MLEKDNSTTYFLWASGEVLLIVVGILLALQIDNWNQKRIEKQVEIDNLENLYIALNENIQIEAMIPFMQRAIDGEIAWIGYLEGNAPYHDSLLDYGYYIGTTATITTNLGFYESLKQKGLETIENKDLRNRLSIIYEQNIPEITAAMDDFDDHFGSERIQFFRNYFNLSQEINSLQARSFMLFDYSLYRIKQIRNTNQMLMDHDFLEFVQISLLFHQNALLFLERLYTRILRVKSLLFQELNYQKYGTPKRREVTLVLNGYTDLESVLVSGEFNNWRPNESMLRTPHGWERSFDLFPGSYEYKFILNGNRWISDPANPDSVFVPEVGVYNSVLTVPE